MKPTSLAIVSMPSAALRLVQPVMGLKRGWSFPGGVSLKAYPLASSLGSAESDMQKFRSWSAPVLLAGLLGALLAGPAQAFSYVMVSDQHLVDSSPLLLRAQVIEAPAPVRGPAGIESPYALQLQQQFKGPPLPRIVRLALPGGVLSSGFGEHHFGIPTLHKGQTLLLFAELRRDGTLQAEQLTLGLFFEQQHQGLRYFTRALDSDDDHGQGRNARFHQPRDAERFETWLRSAVAGRAGDVADYFLEAKALQLPQAKFNLLLGGNGNAVRWFQFDSNTALNWVSTAAGQVGMVQDEFAMITAAANALTNDAGSKLTVTHGGGTIAVPDTHCNDGVSDGHGVLWNDPLNAIPGSYSCASGGVLANGGPCFFTTSTMSNGLPYNEAFEGRIQVQDGVACYFDGDSGKNGAEVMAHEMGHVVGLAHSCGDAQSGTCASATAAEQIATMRATAFGDGRGAALMPDDRAALALVYPAAAGMLFANSFE